MPKNELLQGTLDMLILKALDNGPLHGYSVARWIHERTDDVLRIEEGSLYPALHRLEKRGWVRSEWGVSENNRQAKYYKLTRTGRKQLRIELASWDRLAAAVANVMRPREAKEYRNVTI
jgi:transcriptional regulator